MKLLLISNSTNAGEPYLQYPLEKIDRFLGPRIREVLFIPYAAVTFSYNEYEAKVAARLSERGIKVRSIHHLRDKVKAVKEAQAICVGGGNTFALARAMQKYGLMRAIRVAIQKGTPYLGWSAGSNVACPSIRTTNDMPIVQPESFAAIGAVPYQINPHYLDASPAGHAGETREQRIEEFLAANKKTTVVGLREGCMLWVEDSKTELIGPKSMRVFRYGSAAYEMAPGAVHI